MRTSGYLWVGTDEVGTWDVTVIVYLSSIFHNGYDLYHPVPLIWSLLSWNVWSSSHLFSELCQKMLAMSRFTLWKLVEAILLYDVIQDIIILLQTQDLRVDQEKEPCIRVNTRELNRELYTGLFTLYTKTPWSMLTTSSLP